ncbi:hypothetical protein CDAR_485781 [Caerostris darwini]|uniref:Uncharacterized protein n=1 Tax=Caerostris darwini TaxID=1538125 RepID=A0AAV4WL32_9ARAC|nr:hypothetical protein CDAR_485781 [Caerostris darwini]
MDADNRHLKDDEAKSEKELLHKTESNHYKQDIIGLGEDLGCDDEGHPPSGTPSDVAPKTHLMPRPVGR